MTLDEATVNQWITEPINRNLVKFGGVKVDTTNKPRYRLTFTYADGSTFKATKVTGYVGLVNWGTWGSYECTYSRIKNKTTTETVKVNLEECLSVTVEEYGCGGNIVKVYKNPNMEVVLDISVSTRRQKSKQHNRSQKNSRPENKQDFIKSYIY